LITHLAEHSLFENEEDLRIYLRKSFGHQLTPKGRLWELADGTLNLRFPGSAMDQVEREDGAFVLDWVVRNEDFAIALMDNGIEETGSVFGTLMAMFCIGFVCSHSDLDLPKQNRKKNKCVREYLQICLPDDLSGYEIDRISDIEKPNDVTVADIPFHRNNFQSTKHSLVVKLRTKG
jgi:hypothetical protein